MDGSVNASGQSYEEVALTIAIDRNMMRNPYECFTKLNAVDEWVSSQRGEERRRIPMTLINNRILIEKAPEPLRKLMRTRYMLWSSPNPNDSLQWRHRWVRDRTVDAVFGRP